MELIRKFSKFIKDKINMWKFIVFLFISNKIKKWNFLKDVIFNSNLKRYLVINLIKVYVIFMEKVINCYYKILRKIRRNGRKYYVYGEKYLMIINMLIVFKLI